jgi:hypothetical protein
MSELKYSVQLLCKCKTKHEVILAITADVLRCNEKKGRGRGGGRGTLCRKFVHALDYEF